MRLHTEECDVCGLVWPAEDVTVLTSPCQRYEVAECDLCRSGAGMPGLTTQFPSGSERLVRP